MPKRKQEGPPGTPEWMVTFSDIMSLLVTFFVLLMTFSSFDHDKFDPIAGAMQGAFGVMKRPRQDDRLSVVKLENLSLVRQRLPKGQEAPSDFEPLAVLADRLRNRIEMLSSLEFIDLLHMSHGLVIRIRDGVLFEPGSARLTRSSDEILKAVGAALRHIGNRMHVEGHTDSMFQASYEFASAEELSLARAVAVAGRLVEIGLKPRRMGAGGAGPSRPAFANDTPAGRASNRRVEITILPPPPRGSDA